MHFYDEVAALCDKSEKERGCGASVWTNSGLLPRQSATSSTVELEIVTNRSAEKGGWRSGGAWCEERLIMSETRTCSLSFSFSYVSISEKSHKRGQFWEDLFKVFLVMVLGAKRLRPVPLTPLSDLWDHLLPGFLFTRFIRADIGPGISLCCRRDDRQGRRQSQDSQTVLFCLLSRKLLWFFLEFTWRFSMEKWQGFFGEFPVVSISQRKTHENSSKHSGKFQSIFRSKLQKENSEHSGGFSFCSFSDLTHSETGFRTGRILETTTVHVSQTTSRVTTESWRER